MIKKKIKSEKDTFHFYFLFQEILVYAILYMTIKKEGFHLRYKKHIPKLLLSIFFDSNKISNLRKRRLEMLYSKKINMADIRARI